MEFTMRDKVCQLIGKYNVLEQQAMVKVAGGAFRAMLGKTPTKEEENASEKASIYHWMQEDLKQLLEEDEAPADPRKTAPAGKWRAQRHRQLSAPQRRRGTMGEALAIIIAFAALLGISWGVTCAAVWAICALMHWTFTWAAGTAAWIALWLIGSFCSSKK